MSKLKTNDTNEQEVCYKKILDGNLPSDSNKYNYVKSPSGKVTYKVLNTVVGIFEYQPYKKFFRMLVKLENSLNENLPFDVELDYITLEVIRHYIDSNGYKDLESKLGTKIFMLLTDITRQNMALCVDDIYTRYFTPSSLSQLIDFYNKYEEQVLNCYKKNYSSLYLYDYIYPKAAGIKLLENMTNVLSDENESNIRKDFVSTLLIEYKNEMHKTQSERVHDELSYDIIRINNHLDMFTDSMISKMKCINIDYAYSLIK